MSILLAFLLPVAVVAVLLWFTYTQGIREGRSRVKDDRDALARAAHEHYCLMPGEETHEPDEIDYDKADEVIEILWRLDR